jgi:putative phosphoribosyl transferase
MRRPTIERPLFIDRADAGAVLGERLRGEAWHRPVVLGLARGGVPVAGKVAEALGAPLEVMVCRKIGAPGNPEFGVGAVAAEGPPRYDDSILAALGVTPDDLRACCEQEQAEARARLRRYRRGRAAVPLADRDLIVVDDGLATGVTARAALLQLRAANPRRLVLAVPVCAEDSEAALRAEGIGDRVVCLHLPSEFRAVGLWYREFGQTSDDEVLTELDHNPHR